MSYREFVEQIGLEGRVFAITRVHQEEVTPTPVKGCFFSAFPRLMEQGGTLVFTLDTLVCPGAARGMGFRDGEPNIPGGFGEFIAQGSGKPKCPPGERLKATPELARQMLEVQPKNVLGEYDALKMEPWREGIQADLATIFCNADQLSALTILYHYDKAWDEAILMPMASGCAQVFRLPLGELGRERPRAIVGNTDISSRPYVDKTLLNFTLTAQAFTAMLAFTGECFFHAPQWNPIKRRL